MGRERKNIVLPVTYTVGKMIEVHKKYPEARLEAVYRGSIYANGDEKADWRMVMGPIDSGKVFSDPEDAWMEAWRSK